MDLRYVGKQVAQNLTGVAREMGHVPDGLIVEAEARLHGNFTKQELGRIVFHARQELAAILRRDAA